MSLFYVHVNRIEDDGSITELAFDSWATASDAAAYVATFLESEPDGTAFDLTIEKDRTAW